MSAMIYAPKKLPVDVPLSKGKQTIVVTSSDEANSVEGEDSDFCFETDDEEDDSDCKEEDSQDEEYEVDESETDQERNEQSDPSSDDDDEYVSISENEASEVDDTKDCDQKGGKWADEDDKVANLLRQRNKKLDSWKLEECKSYLRKHSLMISGTKATCIQRILEHWRLKDGNGERFYPISSFTINCTGDVCKGDVVMFKQRVYEKLHKGLRNKKIIGKRTVAGRIVKESYGSAKQQHTFTVEVLWSKGVKPLPSLYTLLVKGRNLYKYRTFRQHWGNEVERSKILEEKHRRGAEARCVRASTRARITADSRIPTGSKHQKRASGSRPHVKPLKRHPSESTPRKKRQKTLVKSSSCYKHAANSASNQLSKKLGTKASSVYQSRKFKTIRQADQSENQVRQLHATSQRPSFPNIYDNHNYNSHANFQRRMNVAAPQASREMILIPVYNYYPNSGYAIPQLLEPHHHPMNVRTNLNHPYDPRGNSVHSYPSSSQHASSSFGNHY